MANILNGHEKALFSLPWLNQRPFEYRIGTTDSNPLHCRRTPQFQHLLLTPFCPRSFQRIPNCKEDRTTHEQRRLSNTSTSLNRPEILPFHVFEKRYIEFLSDIEE